MLKEDFDHLPFEERCDLLQKWELTSVDSNDVLTFHALRHRLSFIETNVSKLVNVSMITLYGINAFLCILRNTALKEIKYCIPKSSDTIMMYTYILASNCLENYQRFLLLCSSKGRVGKKSSLARLPNELFYRMIELFQGTGWKKEFFKSIIQ